MFQINEVVNYNEVPFRVLMQIPEHIIWIAIDDKSALPQLVSKKDLEIAIDEEVLTRIEDPHAELAFQTPEELERSGGDIYKEAREAFNNTTHKYLHREEEQYAIAGFGNDPKVKSDGNLDTSGKKFAYYFKTNLSLLENGEPGALSADKTYRYMTYPSGQSGLNLMVAHEMSHTIASRMYNLNGSGKSSGEIEKLADDWAKKFR